MSLKSQIRLVHKRGRLKRMVRALTSKMDAGNSLQLIVQDGYTRRIIYVKARKVHAHSHYSIEIEGSTPNAASGGPEGRLANLKRDFGLT
jgi:hypothetical protein